MGDEMSIVAISGSPSRPSRTRQLVVAVAERIASANGATYDVVDIAELVPLLAIASRADASEVLERALAAIESADLILAASPVYKGSYSGLFKHLVDLVDYRALQGKPVALLATGGSDRHALVIEHQLRPLFAFFGAHALPTGIFVRDGDLVDGQVEDSVLRQRLDLLVREASDALARTPVALRAIPA